MWLQPSGGTATRALGRPVVPALSPLGAARGGTRRGGVAGPSTALQRLELVPELHRMLQLLVGKLSNSNSRTADMASQVTGLWGGRWLLCRVVLCRVVSWRCVAVEVCVTIRCIALCASGACWLACVGLRCCRALVCVSVSLSVVFGGQALVHLACASVLGPKPIVQVLCDTITGPQSEDQQV